MNCVVEKLWIPRNEWLKINLNKNKFQKMQAKHGLTLQPNMISDIMVIDLTSQL